MADQPGPNWALDIGHLHTGEALEFRKKSGLNSVDDKIPACNQRVLVGQLGDTNDGRDPLPSMAGAGGIYIYLDHGSQDMRRPTDCALDQKPQR